MSARSTRITGSKRDDYMRRFLVGLIAQGLTKPDIRRLATLYSETLFKPAFDTTEIRATVAALWKRFQEEGLFDTMDNVTPRDVGFLWEPYLVQGAVNLLEGDPGVGKTYLLCALAAAISSGGYLPGRPVGKARQITSRKQDLGIRHLRRHGELLSCPMTTMNYSHATKRSYRGAGTLEPDFRSSVQSSTMMAFESRS